MRTQTPALLDRFIPRPDAGGRHEITIHAPAALVMEVARNFDVSSIGAIRALFWMRAKILGGHAEMQLQRRGLVADMLALGWGCLAEEPERYFIGGAACRPWEGDVHFCAIEPARFANFSEPDQVRIAWTLEALPLGPEVTRFGTETRVAATDEASRVKFRGYWRKFGIGIVLIRKILLPLVRREAERRVKAARTSAA
jgi:hypothetical protein